MRSENRLFSELRLYRFFNIIRLCLVVVFAFLFASFSKEQPYLVRLALIGLAFALPFSHSFYSFMREPLRFEMRQGLVAFLSVVQRVLLLVALLSVDHLWPGHLVVLVGAALGTYIVSGLLWRWAFRQHFADDIGRRVHAALDRSAQARRVWVVFSSIVFWVHVNGVISQSVQTLDVFFLSHFDTALSDIAVYSLALKAANFFQMLPIALASSFGIYLARSKVPDTLVGHSRERGLALKLASVFVVGSVAMLMGGLLVAEPLLSILGRGKLADPVVLSQAKQYFGWQLAGVLLLGAGHPITTYMGARVALPPLVLRVALPWALLSTGIFYWAARGGPLNTAQANLIVYGGFNLLMLVHFFCNRTTKVAYLRKSKK